MAHENLQRLVILVDQKIDAYDDHVGDYDHSAYTEWRARKAEAEKVLLAFFVDHEDAHFSKRPPHDYRVRMAGIRSTSTSGYRGALRNWRTAARKKLGEPA